jgi:SdpC family antimicrobial peptide
MKFGSRRAVATAVVGSILVAGGVTAQSAFAHDGSGAASAPGKARLKEAAKETVKYSDTDLLKLLLAAQGPIADAHPELKRMLGFNPDKPHTEDAALGKVVAGYLAAHPGFHQDMAVPFHSGDPVRVDAALRDFSISFNKWLKETSQPVDGGKPQAVAQAKGWFWMGAYVAIYVNAVGAANAVGYTNAGVATNALATLVVVTWYLEDGSPNGSGIERDAFVDALTSALT